MGQDISQLLPEGSRCPLCVLQDQKVSLCFNLHELNISNLLLG
jgi:hypothetical protein